MLGLSTCKVAMWRGRFLCDLGLPDHRVAIGPHQSGGTSPVCGLLRGTRAPHSSGRDFDAGCDGNRLLSASQPGSSACGAVGCRVGGVFAANYHFSAVGTDYFARTAPPSPVQHYWSLAVEEQFYVVWPALLAMALYGFSLLRGRRNLRGAGESLAGRLSVVVAIGVAVSLAWSIHSTQTEPVTAYYSTLTRAWELGVGVLVALWVTYLRKLPVGIRAAMTWAGLIGITIAAITYTAATPFPGYAALLPVVSTALMLGGGVFPQPRHGANALLGRQPLRLIGDTSYSFYLWHWPFLIIAAQYEGQRLSLSTNLELMAVAFALSVVTYHYYENPLRHAERLSVPRDALVLWPATVATVVLVASLAGGGDQPADQQRRARGRQRQCRAGGG